MPLLLALESANEYVSAALLAGADAPVQLELRAGSANSQHLLPMLRQLLTQTGYALEQADVIAFSAGPGSFTGVRVVCAVAQGLGWALDKPLVSVDTLQATALNALDQLCQTQPMLQQATVVVGLDARMQEAYAAQYLATRMQAGSAAGWLLESQIPPALLSSVTWHALLSAAGAASTDVLIGAGNAFSAIKIDTPTPMRVLPQARADAAAIARLGADAFAQGQQIRPEQAKPLYLRDHVAFTTAQREARAQAGLAIGNPAADDAARVVTSKRSAA